MCEPTWIILQTKNLNKRNFLKMKFEFGFCVSLKTLISMLNFDEPSWIFNIKLSFHLIKIYTCLSLMFSNTNGTQFWTSLNRFNYIQCVSVRGACACSMTSGVGSREFLCHTWFIQFPLLSRHATPELFACTGHRITNFSSKIIARTVVYITIIGQI